jgi:hypothetical protein
MKITRGLDFAAHLITSRRAGGKQETLIQTIVNFSQCLSMATSPPLDSPITIVLLTAPSLRSDTALRPALTPVKDSALARPKNIRVERENIMMVLLGYFIIAAMAGVAASAIIGFILTNLLISRFQRADRPVRIPSNR